MRVLDVGGDVFLLRFLPESKRLFVATADADRNATFAILPLATGERVSLPVPGAMLDSWWYDSFYGNPVAVSPGGDAFYLAWRGTLHAFRTTDGGRLRVPDGMLAHQVALSAAGDRLLTAAVEERSWRLWAATTGPAGPAVVWERPMPPSYSQLAGFLPDGDRFVTVDNAQGVVRIRSFETGEELAAGKAKPQGVQQPQISPDGRYLGVLGYGNMYVWDLTTLDKPRKIGGSSNFGDFRSLAFHPDNRRMAVIHGGPTLVKVYDLASLKRIHAWKWKLGPLRSVAFSPDGTLGAAGSVGGQIVVWDEDA